MQSHPMTNRCANCGQEYWVTHVCPKTTKLEIGDGTASDGWPKLTKPARVGNGTFGLGVSARLVVEAAQRQYEYHAEDVARTPEQAREHERKRREAWDMLNGPLGA